MGTGHYGGGRQHCKDWSNDASFQVERNSAGANDFTVDNISVKPLTLASLFSSVTDSKTSDVMCDITSVVLAAGTQQGLVIRLDSAASPANFVLAYFNGAGGIVVDECIAGVYANIMAAVAKAWTTGDTIRIDASGAAIRLYHVTAAGVAVLLGTAVTNRTTGTLHGLFSTYVANTFSKFQVFPKGTGAELEALSSL
jgi:hypothetical protein